MLVTIIRSFILILFVFLTMRLMGKRQIGQLQPFELVVAIMISDIGAAPIQDGSIPLITGIVPILCLFFIQMLFSQLSMSSLKIRNIICGKPSTLILNGIIQEDAMHKEMYSISDLIEQTRNQGYDDITQIHTAILETNGQLSIVPKSMFKPATSYMMNIQNEAEGCARIMIMNGTVLPDNLDICQKNLLWLEESIGKNKKISDVYIFTLLPDGSYFIQFKGGEHYFYHSEVSTHGKAY